MDKFASGDGLDVSLAKEMGKDSELKDSLTKIENRVKLLNQSELTKTLQALTSPHKSYFINKLNQASENKQVKKIKLDKKFLQSPSTQRHLF